MVQQEDILYGRISIAGMPIAIGRETYTGDYTVKPKVVAQVLPTANKSMKYDVDIQAIPYYEVSNISGKTVIIGD